MLDLNYYDSDGQQRWFFGDGEGYVVAIKDLFVVVVNERVYNYFKDLEQAVTCLRMTLPN